MSIDRLQANYPVAIEWLQFPLHPDTPPEGKSLEELFAGRDIEPARKRLRKMMQAAGLPYGDRTHTYNSRKAQELGKWADSLDGEGPEGDSPDGKPRGEALHRALFHAYFADCVDISQVDNLIKITEAAGFDGQAARQALESGAFVEAVDLDWQRSHHEGITGVPTFTAQQLMVVGCQPYEVLERFVKHLLEQAKQEPDRQGGPL